MTAWDNGTIYSLYSHFVETIGEIDDASIPDIPYVEQSERDSVLKMLFRVSTRDWTTYFHAKPH
jgi:hypothetical protein